MTTTPRINPLLLLVDDNPLNLQALQLIFEGQDYDFITANSGPQALQMARDHNPDLVLLDVLMPEMDGYDVCRQIRETPQIAEMPVVMVTALSDAAARLEGFEAGADDFVSKPLDALELRTRVRSITRMNRYRRLVAERLRQEQLIKLAPCGWVICDASGKIHMSNDRLAELLGMSPSSSLAGLSFASLFTREERNRVSDWLRSESTEIERLETRLSCIGSSEKLWVELACGRFGQQGQSTRQVLITDVTQRKKLERVQMEERFRALVQETTDLVATISTRGTYQYVSPAAEQVVGLTAQELIGTSFMERVHPEERDAVREGLAEVLQKPGAIVHLDYRHRHHDGEWRNLRTSIRNALADEHVGAVVVNARDITEQQALWNQLLQAQKMDAVGQLAAGVAHDFNNLLAVIMNYSFLALDHLPEDSPVRKDIAAIERSAKRGAALTRQLLTFSRQETNLPRQVDLPTLVQEMQAMLQPLLGEHIALSIETPETPGIVEADPGQLEQVVLNLVVNARDALNENGAIKVVVDEFTVEDEKTDATQTLVLPGDYLRVIVQDNGCGMDEKVRQRIFEPFFTTKEPNKGTGLGLSTVFGIVKKCRGAIFLTTAPGEGTSFEIYFPRVPASKVTISPSGVSRAEETVARILERTKNQERIMVVEDDPDILDAVERFLGKMGHEVFATGLPKTALERCDENPEQISLLITDLMMPETNGIEVLTHLRERRPDVPCICMSGYLEEYIQELQEFDRVWLLPKPFSLSQFTETVREAMSAANATPMAQT